MSVKKYFSKVAPHRVVINILMLLFSLCFIIPMLMIISSSLISEESLNLSGYAIFPREFDFSAYKHIMKNSTQIVNSYKTTIFTSATTCIFGTLLMCMAAYPISRKYYFARKPCTFIIFFTMLFGGGLIPTYIVYTQWLFLGNTYWIYILPCLVSAWNIIIIRSFFSGIPDSLVEAAKIDGAGEFKVLFSIIIPLSKPVIATVALLTLLGRWNDWNTALLFIRDSEKYSLQYLLQRILNEVNFLKEMSQNTELGGINAVNKQQQVAGETLRFAMVVVAAGPMLVIFPFFQKYFARGLTVGAVKG